MTYEVWGWSYCTGPRRGRSTPEAVTSVRLPVRAQSSYADIGITALMPSGRLCRVTLRFPCLAVVMVAWCSA